MSAATAVANQLARHGAAWTLRRGGATGAGPNAWTAASGAPTFTYAPCRARERNYRPDEIKGPILDTDVEIVLDPATLAVTPVKGDKLAPGTLDGTALNAPWRTIIAVLPRFDGAKVAVYRIQARL